MSNGDSLEKVFSKVLKLGSALVGAVAVLGAVAGFIFAGVEGALSALIGAALTLLFVSLTVLSVWFGAKLPLGGFFGVVLGGWLAKLLLFVLFISLLKDAEFISGPVLFFTLVVSIFGTLAIDTKIALSARIPLGN
jgi:hypothetical protein